MVVWPCTTVAEQIVDALTQFPHLGKQLHEHTPAAPPAPDYGPPPDAMPKPRRGGTPTLREAGRVYWMSAWRLAVLTIFTGVTFLTFFRLTLYILPVASIALVYAARLTFAKRPVLGLLKFRAPIVPLDLDYSEVDAYLTTRRRPRPKTDNLLTLRAWEHFEAKARENKPTIERASRPGVMTGYEPEHLKSVPLPSGPLVFGNPGIGLASSGFSDGAIQAGQRGEENFAKALAKAGLTDRFATFWSVGMPEVDGSLDPKYANVDIDAVVVTGTTIWLVDMKNYRQGDVVYSTFGERLYVEDVETGSWVGEPYKMSRNMANAQMRFEAAFGSKGYRVRSRVVLMPTGNGMGRVDGVSWPGDVRAMSLPDFLDAIKHEPAYAPTGRQIVVESAIKKLLK